MASMMNSQDSQAAEFRENASLRRRSIQKLGYQIEEKIEEAKQKINEGDKIESITIS